MSNSRRGPGRTTEGATLIVSLLIVMLLLAVIMSVTAQVTLSSRRSSTEQQAILSARYAAESGVAQVQARLKTMKALLDDASIPPTVRTSVIEGQLSALCGGLPLPAPSPGLVTVCQNFPDSGLREGGDRLALFLQAVDLGAFRNAGFRHATDATRSEFWASMFSGKTGVRYSGSDEASQYQTDFGLIPTRLTRTGGTYKLFFEVPSAASQGTSGSTAQRLSARASAGGKGEYYLLIARPPFARFGLFTDHHFQSQAAEDAGRRINFTSRTLFSGPVHTNQRFLFNEEPVFWGEVTSAGCRTIATDPVTGEPGCGAAPEPGAYFGAADEQFLCYQKAGAPPCGTDMANQGAPNEASSVNAPIYKDNKPKFKSTVKWDADYIKLPDNSLNQHQDAVAGGLALEGEVAEMQLWRDTVAGQERQRITYVQGGVTAELSYNANRELFILDAGTWKPAGRDSTGKLGVLGSAFPASVPFNGVISVNGGGIDDLNGGPNVAFNDARGASVASFAGITVATTGSMRVTSSLKYTDPPCSGANTATAQAPCGNLAAKNILGLYSSAGDVNLVSPESCGGVCKNIGQNPQIHAVLMASQGAVQVEGWDKGPATGGLGQVNLIGGIIEKYYGAFGTVEGTGYGRNVVYDQRTYDGYSPPSFPTQENWTVGLHLKSDGAAERPSPEIRLQGDTVSAGKGWAP